MKNRRQSGAGKGDVRDDVDTTTAVVDRDRQGGNQKAERGAKYAAGLQKCCIENVPPVWPLITDRFPWQQQLHNERITVLDYAVVM